VGLPWHINGCVFWQFGGSFDWWSKGVCFGGVSAVLMGSDDMLDSGFLIGKY